MMIKKNQENVVSIENKRIHNSFPFSNRSMHHQHHLPPLAFTLFGPSQDPRLKTRPTSNLQRRCYLLRFDRPSMDKGSAPSLCPKKKLNQFFFSTVASQRLQCPGRWKDECGLSGRRFNNVVQVRLHSILPVIVVDPVTLSPFLRG